MAEKTFSDQTDKNLVTVAETLKMHTQNPEK